MTQTFSVVYMNCSSCAARNHCAACGQDLAASLTARPGITAAAVDIPNKQAAVTHTLDPDDLEDILDGMGLLLG